jgi:kynurenine 3-monooxygenase
MSKKVVIIGAGPSGVLLAHYLLRRDDKYQIDIYERRSDPRIVSFSKSRTYPLSLSERGMSALRNIPGIEEAVKEMSVEIKGTIFHQKNGKTQFMPRKKPLVALDRTNLVIALLNQLSQNYDSSRLKIHFNHLCSQVNFETKTVKFQNLAKEISAQEVETDLVVEYDLLIGADGARSFVREHFLSTKLFEYEQKYVTSDYKSIFLPCTDELKPSNVHAWRVDDGTVALILHQHDRTMSGVIYFPRNNNKLAELSTTQEVFQFFHDNFPVLGKLLPESEAEAFLKRPISTALTIRCSRYHYEDSVLLIGDAVHSVSPTTSQGCNAALEDVIVFDNLLDEYSDNLAAALEQFTVRRKPDAQALVELGNNAFPLSPRLYIEYIFRDRLAKFLHQLFPKRFSPPIYELISESSVPYSETLKLYKGWVSRVKRSNEKFLEGI